MRRGLAALKSYLWCARLCGLSEKRLRAFDGAEKRSETHFCLTINIGTRVLVHFSKCRVRPVPLLQDEEEEEEEELRRTSQPTHHQGVIPHLLPQQMVFEIASAARR